MSLTVSELRDYIANTTHCSALVKLDANFTNLWMGQSAWFRYQVMNRVYKHCALAWAGE